MTQRQDIEKVIVGVLRGHDERSKKYKVSNDMLAYEILDGLFDAGYEVRK